MLGALAGLAQNEELGCTGRETGSRGGASSDPGEGSLARRLNGRQLYVWHAVDSEGEGLTG
jgi:hypothetical protein